MPHKKINKYKTSLKVGKIEALSRDSFVKLIFGYERFDGHEIKLVDQFFIIQAVFSPLGITYTAGTMSALFLDYIKGVGKRKLFKK